MVVDYVSLEQDQGLHQRRVNQVVRDQIGYFYLIMPDVIQRYDGETFEYINTSALSEAKLTPNSITKADLLADGSISLNIGPEEGMYIIRPRSMMVSKLDVAGSLLASDGLLYTCLSESPGKYTLSAVGYTGKNLELGAEYPVPDVPTKVYFHNDRTYLSTADGTVYRTTAGSQYERLAEKGSIIKANGNVYLWTIKAVWDITRDTELVVVLPDTTMQLTQLKVDSKGNMTASYSAQPRFNHAIYQLTPDEEFRSLDNVVDVGNRLFIDYWTDDADYKWMLVGHNAIKVISLLRDGAYIHHKNPAAKKGEFGNVMSGVATDHEGNTYYLREQRGFHKIVGDSDHSDAMPATLFTDVYYNNGKLYHSPHDNLLYSYGYRYDGTSQIFTTDPKSKTYTAATINFKVNDIYPTSGELLVGGYDSRSNAGKLAWFDIATGRTTEVGDSLAVIRSIYYDESEGHYWIGTTRGIHVLDKTFAEVAVLNSRSEISDSSYLANEYVVMITEYNDRLIAGSLGGIYVINPRSKKVERHITDFNGLSNGRAIGIMPDDLGYCWITTFNGVNIMDSTFQIIKQIYDHQGLSDREFNSKAIAKTPDGRIYGGTLNGITGFDPKKVLEWSEPYGLDVQKIMVHTDGVERELALDSPSFYSSADSVVIQYKTPDYYDYPFIRDATQTELLAGAADVSKQGKHIVLKNMQKGDILVALTNPITSRNATVKLQAKSDYRLPLSALGFMLLVGLASWLIVRYNKKKAYQWSRLQARVAELQLTSLQSQMNPHFIFNALGAIQYFIQTHNAEKADEYLSNFAMLMRRILESSKSKYIRLSNEVETLKLYVGLEHVRFEQMFEYKFVVDEDVELDTNVPPMIIQPYIENAINHGLYNLTDRQGQLTVSLQQVKPDTVKITVNDNGVGRAAAKQLRTKRHKSRGLEIINERIETINKSNELHVEVAVQDLYHEGKSTGTNVEILITEIE